MTTTTSTMTNTTTNSNNASPDDPRPTARPRGIKSVIADNTGMRIALPWSAWAALAALTFGGASGYAGFKLVTAEQLQHAIQESETKQMNNVTTLSKKVEAQGNTLADITSTVNNVQIAQHQDIAIREARRVVNALIRCRPNESDCLFRQENERERLRRLNMIRLASKPPEEPCIDLDCR